MKKLLLVAIAVSIPVMAQAAISVDEMTNSAALKNNGYSEQVTDAVNVSKARANNQEYYTADEEAFRNQNKFVRFWRKFYAYMDPAAEDYSMYHHDTTTSPSYTDL